MKDELSDHNDRIYALEEDNKNIRILLSKIASKVDDIDSDDEVNEELIQRENQRRGAFKTSSQCETIPSPHFHTPPICRPAL